MRAHVSVTILLLSACADERQAPQRDVDSFAGGCFTVATKRTALVSSGASISWQDAGTPLRLHYSALGTTLLYDPQGGFVHADGDALSRETALQSDVTQVDDSYVSGAEWALETHARDHDRYALRSRRTGTWLTEDGLTDAPARAAALSFEPAEGCADFPELSVDATGTPARSTWEDGELYGYVDMHSHLMTNFAFGGGLFHGSPFHRLGVTHAMGDCEVLHGPQGRKDFFGYTYDHGGDMASLLPDMLRGELAVENHATAGYPAFTDWPNSIHSSTHQTQYYRWIERAWLSGLRLIVHHATSNAVICKLTVGEGWSPARYDCEDMTAVSRQVDAAWEMVDYIDAQHGGPGQGWFRVVTSPAEAREVIAAGKLAVVLGIETSDLFNCPLTPRPGGPVCDEAHVDAELDKWHARGVRALFPNHKYDNAFTPGDGSGDFIEAGNFLNTGYYTNKVTDCPTDVPTVFDRGPVTLGGLLAPRDLYQSVPDADFSALDVSPLDTVLPYAGALLQGPVEGDHCQNATLTPLGEHLLRGMLQRGMLPELDHLPRRAYKRAFEILTEADYPALGTHGNDNYERLYGLGGLSSASFQRCHDPANPGAAFSDFQRRLDAKRALGQHPSQGFGFDYNGFASGPRPRFGPEGCGTPQEAPVTWPFTSYDGCVTFTQPVAGERTFDFNTEGMVHIGLLPEYIQDLRNDGVPDAQLEPLFRSAEGYVQLWERAEARGEDLRADLP